VAADRARLTEHATAGRRLVPDAESVDNVVAMAYGALTAPAP